MASIAEQKAAALRKFKALEERERKQETRKKIIVGAAVMKKLSADELLRFIDSEVTNKKDRQLLGLPLRQPQVKDMNPFDNI